MTEESFRERAARLRAEVEASKAAAAAEAEAAKPTFDPSEIPEPDEGSGYTPTEADQEIDRVVDGLDIIDAYRRYCGKMEPKVGRRRESIMISCPRLDHTDSVPSAWINIDEQVWYCGKCDDGGDVITLVARTKGYEGKSYQEGRAFPDLKRSIAEDLGYVLRKTATGEPYIVEPEPEDESSSEEPTNNSQQSLNPAKPRALSAVPEPSSDDSAPIPVVIYSDEREAASIHEAIPVIEWQNIVAPGTFLYEWMNVMRLDDLPNEFYWWHGLTAVGLAGGRDAILWDRHPVQGNLYICLFGPSGQGKTRSSTHLLRLLREALPYDKRDPKHKGVLLAPMPGSPESLIDTFARPIEDPADPKVVLEWGSVRALLRFNELSTLIGRSTRAGNPIKPLLHDLYDGDVHISTSSRGHGVVEAHNAFGSMITTTQPKAIRQVFVATDVDSGFANRFVYVMGHSKPPIPFGGPELDITEPVKLLGGIHSWASFGRKLKMTEDALKAWSAFYAAEMRQYHETEDTITSRIPLLMKKIILLLAMNAKETAVSLDTINSAIMMYPYLQATYAYISGDLGTGERQELDNAIIDAAQRIFDMTGRGASARDIITRLAKRFPRDASTIRRCLDDLCALGLLNEQVTKPAGGGRGRPTSRYTVAV